jgi:hypothetical protein
MDLCLQSTSEDQARHKTGSEAEVASELQALDKVSASLFDAA